MTFEALASSAGWMRHAWNAARILVQRLFFERDFYQFTRIRIELARGLIRCEVQNETVITTPGRGVRTSWCKPKSVLKSEPSLLVSSRRKRGENHEERNRSS